MYNYSLHLVIERNLALQSDTYEYGLHLYIIHVLLVSTLYVFLFHLSLSEYLHKLVTFPTVDLLQDGQLSIAALECLQHKVKVPLFESIGMKWQHFAISVGMAHETAMSRQDFSPEVRGRSMISIWLGGRLPKPATWRSLVDVLKSLKELNPKLTRLTYAVIEFFFPEGETII